MKYYIVNVGCDDKTAAKIDMTDEDAKTFIKICNQLNENATYQCQPIIRMYKITDCEFISYDEEEPFIFPKTDKNLLIEREN